MSTADFQSVFSKVKKSIADADAALVSGTVLIQQVQRRVQQIEESCAEEHRKIDHEIQGVVDAMDEETVRFVGQLEALEVEA